MLELTVLWEENMEEAHERKHPKYLELVELSGTTKRGTVQAATDACRESHKMALDKKGMACCYWDARQDLINPGCANPPPPKKTSADPRNITDDASQRIHRGASYKLYNTCFSNIEFSSRAVQKAGKLFTNVVFSGNRNWPMWLESTWVHRKINRAILLY